MQRTWILLVFGLVLAGRATPAHAQESVPSEQPHHAIVYEIGWASSWSSGEGFRPAGGTLAFEVTPVDHWLELEIGATGIRAGHGTETSVDLLFKKPWSISHAVELMAGVGPEVIHQTGPPDTYLGVEAVADIMFWPARNVGWYVEPGYERTFPRVGAHGGLAFAAGMLIGH